MDAIITKSDLQINLSLKEVVDFYAEALNDQGVYGQGFREFTERRAEVSMLVAGAELIEVVVVDFNEFVGRQRAVGTHDDVWEGGHLKGTGIDPDKVPAMLAALGDYQPAGLWEIGCFGILNREYFKALKHNPQYLIAPLNRYNGYHSRVGHFSGARAVSTSAWGCLSWYYAEPQYPRVLGYKTKTR